MKKKLIIAVLAICMMLPGSIRIVAAEDIPAQMQDNVYLDALEYIGYDVDYLAENGLLYKKGYMGESTPSAAQSKVKYKLSGQTGMATVNDETTATGKAPNVNSFVSAGGMGCAAFVSYVLFNYLVNIKGWDMSAIKTVFDGAATQGYGSTYKYQKGLAAAAKKKVVINGEEMPMAQKVISKMSLSKASSANWQAASIGDIIAFTEGTGYNTYKHVGLYAGTFNGLHYVIHCGGPNVGPCITTMENLDSVKSLGAFEVWHLNSGNSFQSKGSIVIEKLDEQGNKLNGCSFKAVNKDSGDVYYFVQEESFTDEETGEYIDNSGIYVLAGDEDIEYGTYIISEMKAAKGYQLAADQEITIDENTPDGVAYVTFTDEYVKPQYETLKVTDQWYSDGKVQVLFTKKDSVSESPLKGVGVKVYVDDVCIHDKEVMYTDENGEIHLTYTPAQPYMYQVISEEYYYVSNYDQLTDYMKNQALTNPQLYIETDKAHVAETISQANQLAQASAKTILEKLMADSAEQRTHTFKIEEISTLDSYYFTAENTTQITVSDEDTVSLTMSNEPKTGKITITKLDQHSQKPVSNTVYGLYAHDDIYTADGKTLVFAAGQQVGLFPQTDENGIAVLTQLYLGKYDVKEIQSAKGYVLDEQTYTVDLTSTVNEAVVEKKLTLLDEKQTFEVGLKKVFSDGAGFCQDVEFEVYHPNGQLFTTLQLDNKGNIKVQPDWIEGSYYLKEVKTNKNYNLLAETVSFTLEYDNTGNKTVFVDLGEIENELKKASVTIVKKDKENGGAVSGAVYGLYALEDVVSADSTQIYYQQGELVEEFYSTDEYGKATLDNLYPGKYYVQEIKSAFGYALSQENTEVDLTLKDEENIFTTVEVFDLKQRFMLSLTKIMEGGFGLEDVEFEITSQYDEQFYEILSLQEDGTYMKEVDWPEGKYTLKETQTNQYHQMLEDAIEFELKYDDSGEAVVKVELEEIVNPLREVDVMVYKKDQSSGKLLNKAVYEVKNSTTGEELGYYSSGALYFKGQPYDIVEISIDISFENCNQYQLDEEGELLLAVDDGVYYSRFVGNDIVQKRKVMDGGFVVENIKLTHQLSFAEKYAPYNYILDSSEKLLGVLCEKQENTIEYVLTNKHIYIPVLGID